MKTNKRGQAWGIDLIIAFIIFLMGILIFFVYSVNYSEESKENLYSLSHDGDIIFNSILSEGYPMDWNSTNVIRIGILTNGRINETKLERFYNFSVNNYAKTKNKFNTPYDYYFNMSSKIMISTSVIEGIGKPGINLNNLNSSNLIKITKFTIYKEKPVTAYLYVWS